MTPPPTRSPPVDLETGLVIALESSSRRASVAARFRGRVVQAELESDRAHASDLLPTIDRLVASLGATPKHLAAVVVGTGPGSYTGLRVGIATALGLARAGGAAVLGVPSGEALCFGACAVGSEIVLLLDARSGELYCAHYRRTAHEVETIVAPCVLRPSEVAAYLANEAVIFGDATVGEAAALDAATRARVRTDIVPHASAVLELGTARIARGIESALSDLEPLYLRPFAATERKR